MPRTRTSSLRTRAPRQRRGMATHTLLCVRKHRLAITHVLNVAKEWRKPSHCLYLNSLKVVAACTQLEVNELMWLPIHSPTAAGIQASGPRRSAFRTFISADQRCAGVHRASSHGKQAPIARTHTLRAWQESERIGRSGLPCRASGNDTEGSLSPPAGAKAEHCHCATKSFIHLPAHGVGSELQSHVQAINSFLG